jgi:hypothetical protein
VIYGQGTNGPSFVPNRRQIKIWDNYVKGMQKFSPNRRTYLMSGNRVSDQIMTLIPPMMSSSGGVGPEDGQMPFKT